MAASEAASFPMAASLLKGRPASFNMADFHVMSLPKNKRSMKCEDDDHYDIDDDFYV